MRKKLVAMACCSLAVSTPVSAATVFDPVGDFLPSYTGPQIGELDVTSFSVVFDPASSIFTIGGTLAGAIDPATGGFYAIGVDTGAGAIAPFGSIGQPNVTFDQVVVVAGAGDAFVGADDLDFTISGNTFSVLVPLALLPSTGADPLGYGFNLWPRTDLTPTNLPAISDFAPENALLNPSAVPEPSTWLMLLAGFGLIGSALRSARRQKQALSPG